MVRTAAHCQVCVVTRPLDLVNPSSGSPVLSGERVGQRFWDDMVGGGCCAPARRAGGPAGA